MMADLLDVSSFGYRTTIGYDAKRNEYWLQVHNQDGVERWDYGELLHEDKIPKSDMIKLAHAILGTLVDK
jgi:hypothetical protein